MGSPRGHSRAPLARPAAAMPPPAALVCHICGRQYMKGSIAIHVGAPARDVERGSRGRRDATGRRTDSDWTTTRAAAGSRRRRDPGSSAGAARRRRVARPRRNSAAGLGRSRAQAQDRTARASNRKRRPGRAMPRALRAAPGPPPERRSYPVVRLCSTLQEDGASVPTPQKSSGTVLVSPNSIAHRPSCRLPSGARRRKRPRRSAGPRG